jgi:hypothetical protein
MVTPKQHAAARPDIPGGSKMDRAELARVLGHQ